MSLGTLLAAICAVALAQDGDGRSLLGEIEAYDTQIAQLDGQLATLAATLATAEADRQSRLTEAAAATARVGQRADSARSLVAGLYRLRRFGLLRLLFAADDPTELRRRSVYLRMALARDEAHTAEFAELAEAKGKAAASVQTANETTRQLRAQLSAQREGLDAERRRRAGRLRDLRQTPVLAARVATETQGARREFDSSARSREGSMPESAAAPTNTDFRTLRGQLPRPVSGRLVRGFGAYTDPATGARATNQGLDWATDTGSSFRSVAAGVVSRAGYVRGYGQMVMVQHGSYATLYAHANGLRVVVDQPVQAGDVLGIVGTTGLAEDTTPQLHFELRYNGTPQDPAEWLRR